MIKQTGEEIANTATHLSGVLLSAIFGLLLLFKGNILDLNEFLGISLFSLSAFIMYISSSIYHWAMPGKLKRVLRYFDHSNIYILIAASYTPILLCAVKGKLGWWMFGILWTVAIFGIIYKIFFLGKYPRLSLMIYLTMGWSVVFIAKSVWLTLPSISLVLILCEGILYTIGTYFFSQIGRASCRERVLRLV